MVFYALGAPMVFFCAFSAVCKAGTIFYLIENFIVAKAGLSAFLSERIANYEEYDHQHGQLGKKIPQI